MQFIPSYHYNRSNTELTKRNSTVYSLSVSLLRSLTTLTDLATRTERPEQHEALIARCNRIKSLLKIKE